MTAAPVKNPPIPVCCAVAGIRRQRGAASLIVTMMLFFAMALVALFVNRNLVFEQRSAANQYRSTQAFEAAEAGLEWAEAQLNGQQLIGANCQPGDGPAATAFRTRYLSFDAATAGFTPVGWQQNGAAQPLRPGCVKTDGAWSCSCPSQGPPSLPAPVDNQEAPAFSIQFLPSGKPGLVQVSSTGCSQLAEACSGPPGSTADASAKVQVLLGWVAGLRTAPAAALTSHGAFDADAATLGLHNPDPATGLALHTGGSVAAGQARWSAPAGAPLSTALAGDDAALAALTSGEFFAGYFGLDPDSWKHEPSVTSLVCNSVCNDAVAAAIGSAGGVAMLWVDGDMALTGPLTLGSVAKPVLLVVSGAAHLDGAVNFTGLVYSGAMTWNGTAAGGLVRGAVIVDGTYGGNGTPDFFYDTRVLASLTNNAGSFARVSGSWRDF